MLIKKNRKKTHVVRVDLNLILVDDDDDDDDERRTQF